MGGNDEESNLVKLTPRQHFIAHRLLAKFTTGKAKFSMIKAIRLMSLDNTSTKYKPNSRVYDKVRSQYLLNHKLSQKISVGCDSDIFNIGQCDVRSLSFHRTVRSRIALNSTLTELNRNFLLACIELYQFGFNGVVSPTTAKYVYTSCISKAEKLGYLVKVEKGYRFTEKLVTCSSSVNPDLISFNKYLKGLTETIKGVSKEVNLYNRKNRNNLICLKGCKDKSSQSKTPILEPFNNWLSLDHPLVHMFYRPITVQQAKSTLERLTIINSEYKNSTIKYTTI